jgi:uncharacterized SAM-dependent methyltransferase
LLVRINRELGADFDVPQFQHVAQWNPRCSRIEMYLVSRRAQTVIIDALGMSVEFAAGERIHTENSYKYTQEMTRSMLRNGGFELEQTWMDRRQWFAVHLARAGKVAIDG